MTSTSMFLRASGRASINTRSYATKPRPKSGKPAQGPKPSPARTPKSIPYDEFQTLTLPDSRTLGFSTYGLSTAPALLVFHGFPGSRLDARGMVEGDPGIRVIGIDRPGIGLSTAQKNRRLLDWPADVMHLTRHLGIQSFRIIGGSGGGPYALACANVMPKDVLKATAVVSGFGPVEPGSAPLSSTSRMESILRTNRPYARALLTLATWWSVGRRFNSSDPMIRAKALREYAAQMGHDGDLSKDDMHILAEPFRQGVGGYVEDALVLHKPWGFRLEDMPARNVSFWYGESDTNTPVHMGRDMADRLEVAVMKTFPGETHFTLPLKHGDSIIRELMKVG